MADLSILAGPALIIATALITMAITWRLYSNQHTATQQRITTLTADRDQLLTVVGDFVDAIHYRPDQLDKVAHQAREAIDGRWVS